jgi:hypothetical protein
MMMAKSPTNRERAIATIVADVARNGKAGLDAIRAYTENRISRQAFNEACAKGMEWYRKRDAARSDKP